jgi:hypothetical protein
MLYFLNICYFSMLAILVTYLISVEYSRYFPSNSMLSVADPGDAQWQIQGG